jgi:hypothetical protein
MTDIVATLVFDSWTEGSPVLRAVEMQDRHLIYEGDGIILDLLVRREGTGTCVHIGGQVLPGDQLVSAVSDVPVVLEQGKTLSATHTNALGEFNFHSVPSGTFDLAITLGKRRFMVRGLANKEPRNWRIVSTERMGIV